MSATEVEPFETLADRTAGAGPARSRLVVTELPPPVSGQRLSVEVEGRAIVIFNRNGSLFGLDAACSHAGGPLDQGSLDGDRVVCPSHKVSFDLVTGKVTGSPWTLRKFAIPVRPYRVEQIDGHVAVRIPT